MSAIASFYLVPDSRLADVLAAATPAPSGWFRSPRDTFHEVLGDSSRKLDPFTAGSGWVFNTLDLYLEDRHGFMYGAFGDAEISDPLSKARGSYWLALPPAAETEAGRSRVVGGIHYRFDGDVGLALGRRVADWAIQSDVNGGAAFVIE